MREQMDNKKVEKFWMQNWKFLVTLNQEHPLFMDLLEWAMKTEISFEKFVQLGEILDRRLTHDKW